MPSDSYLCPGGGCPADELTALRVVFWVSTSIATVCALVLLGLVLHRALRGLVSWAALHKTGRGL